MVTGCYSEVLAGALSALGFAHGALRTRRPQNSGKSRLGNTARPETPRKGIGHPQSGGWEPWTLEPAGQRAERSGLLGSSQGNHIPAGAAGVHPGLPRSFGERALVVWLELGLRQEGGRLTGALGLPGKHTWERRKGDTDSLLAKVAGFREGWAWRA